MICTEHLSCNYYPHFFHESLANHYFTVLSQHLNWQIEHYQLFGKIISSPRLIAWHGEEGIRYRYSGIVHTANPWTEDLLTIKSNLEKTTHYTFNSVLANRYRNGQDSMSWHTDNEKELGPQPVIASLSFGATRIFHLRSISKPRQYLKIALEHGSLFIMHGMTQHHWQHAILKSKKCHNARINLTYRWIHTEF